MKLIIIFSFSIVKLFEVSGFIFTTNQIRLGNEVSILEIFNNSYKLVKSKIKKNIPYLLFINILKLLKLKKYNDKSIFYKVQGRFRISKNQPRKRKDN